MVRLMYKSKAHFAVRLMDVGMDEATATRIAMDHYGLSDLFLDGYENLEDSLKQDMALKHARLQQSVKNLEALQTIHKEIQQEHDLATGQPKGDA